MHVSFAQVPVDIPDFKVVCCPRPTDVPPSIITRYQRETYCGGSRRDQEIVHKFNPLFCRAEAICDLELEELFANEQSWSEVGEEILSQFSEQIKEAFESENARYYTRKRAALSCVTIQTDLEGNRMTGAELGFYLFVGRQR